MDRSEVFSPNARAIEEKQNEMSKSKGEGGTSFYIIISQQKKERKKHDKT